MLSTAIIIFREALEISLILGIVIAATQDLKGRAPWIWAGIGAGVAGSALLAVFADKISEMSEGLGQEMMNAIILFTAAFFIGWTAIWMKQHAHKMSHKIKKIGADIAEGILPLSTLTLVIGVSILREGTEIVLFLHSMLLSDQSVYSISMGALIGIVLGFSVGAALYFGMLRMSVKYMMKVTGCILVLLVAGLSSKGASFLNAAGYFEGFSSTVWNSSWLISDSSIAGQLLSGLIGYSAQPSQIQIIFYIATLGILLGIMTLIDGEFFQKKLERKAS